MGALGHDAEAVGAEDAAVLGATFRGIPLLGVLFADDDSAITLVELRRCGLAQLEPRFDLMRRRGVVLDPLAVSGGARALDKPDLGNGSLSGLMRSRVGGQVFLIGAFCHDQVLSCCWCARMGGSRPRVAAAAVQSCVISCPSYFQTRPPLIACLSPDNLPAVFPKNDADSRTNAQFGTASTVTALPLSSRG